MKIWLSAFFAAFLGASVIMRMNWESVLLPRLNEKSDEIVSAFSKRLNETTAEALARIPQGIEKDSSRVNVERRDKVKLLLDAAKAYEKNSRPALVELCFLSALKCSDGNSGVVLDSFLEWKAREFVAMSDKETLAESSAKLMSLYETIDRVLPDSTALPTEIERALLTCDKIRSDLIKRQEDIISDTEGKISWDKFDAKDRLAYQETEKTLTAFAPINEELALKKAKLLALTDELIQTATALSSVSPADLIPPSPKAHASVLDSWFKQGLALITGEKNQIEDRVAGLSVLMSFARDHSEAAECKRYAELLKDESLKLACAHWTERVQKYWEMADKEEKPHADSFAFGQSLLNEGFTILKSLTNRVDTTNIVGRLPTLAAKLNLQREMLLIAQIRLASRDNAFPSKEQSARMRSVLYSQVLNALFEIISLEDQLIKECKPAPESLRAIKDIQGRFSEYLAALEQRDRADLAEQKADGLDKMRQQQQRYASHCREKIKAASTWYDMAEAAKSGLNLWSDEKPQYRLKTCLTELYSVDLNDLNRADAGAAAEWVMIEEKAKKNYKGTPAKLNSETPKKTLIDF
jgi:hypothetical protein